MKGHKKKRHRTKSEGTTNKRLYLDPVAQDFNMEVTNENFPPNPEQRKTIGTISNQDTLDKIITGLEQLNSKVDRIESKQVSIEKTLSGEEGITNKLCIVQEENGVNSGQIATHSQDLSDIQEEIAVLKGIIVRQSQQIDSLKVECEDLRNRGMRNNVLFHNIPEKDGDIPEQSVTHLLQEMKLNPQHLSFERVHRLGPRTQSKYPRPIVAKLISHKDVMKILEHGKKMERGQGKPFITPQYTAQLRERRKTLYEQAEDIKKTAGQTPVQTRLVHDKLIVNGQVHQDPLPPPSRAEVLQLTAAQREDLVHDAPQLTVGDCVQKEGHTLQAIAATVHNINDVRKAYKAVLCLPGCMGAAHIIAAYSLYDPQTTKSKSGWQDDNEHGAGRFVAHMLQRRNIKNTVVFITRKYFKSSHLGPNRFQTMEEATRSALQKMNI